VVARRIRGVIAVGVGALAAVSVATGAEAASPAPRPAAAAADHAQGLVWDGLTTDARCPGGFRVADVPDDVVRCSHGPDPAPAGVDVRDPISDDALHVAGTSEGATSATSSTVPCSGNGVDGNRVQAVYAYAGDKTDRYTAALDPIAGWAGNVDKIFADSAAETGGTRHVSWVTDADCRLSVLKVRMTSTGDDSFSNTINELKSAGLSRADRKYLIWVDATVYCGMAEFRNDDSPGTANANNAGASFARIDSQCWGLTNSAEAHELMHMLGGVQHSAPNSTGGAHCKDEYDRMCYADTQGVAMTYPCASTHERLFDCGHDDYFHTNPATGTYLATHWNAASSIFLTGAEPSTAEPDPPAPSSTTTTTTSWSGSLTRKVTSSAHGLSTGDGVLSLTLTFTKAKSLTLSVLDASGGLIASATGRSNVTLSPSVPSGLYSVVISGAQSTFTVAATYTTP
jgi:hypothetical protein